MSWNLGGVMRIAFPEADHNLSCHRTPRGWLKQSVRSCPMFVCSGLMHAGDTWIQPSYFIYHVAVRFALSPLFFSSSCSLMCWLLLFIPVPVALLSPQLADVQLTWAFASVEVCWSVKERPQEDNAGFLWAPCRLSACASTGLVSARACQHSSCRPSLVGFCEGEGWTMPKGTLYFLGITTTGQCPANAVCLSEKSGGVYKIEGIFGVQFVIVFWWCISSSSSVAILIYFQRVEIRMSRATELP